MAETARKSPLGNNSGVSLEKLGASVESDGAGVFGPSQGPNRPILEFFLKKSCISRNANESGLAFFEWCSEPNERVFKIDCGISGSAPCPSQIQFVKASSNLAPTILKENRIKNKWYTQNDYIGVYMEQQCSWGGANKGQKLMYSDSFETKQAQAYYTNECYRTAYGDPAMPIWAILLIIIAMLAAVGIAFTIFYFVWLRRRIKGRDGMTSSALSSISSISAISSIPTVSKRSALASGGLSNLDRKTMSNARSTRSKLRSTSRSNQNRIRELGAP